MKNLIVSFAFLAASNFAYSEVIWKIDGQDTRLRPTQYTVTNEDIRIQGIPRPGTGSEITIQVFTEDLKAFGFSSKEFIDLLEKYDNSKEQVYITGKIGRSQFDSRLKVAESLKAIQIERQR